MKIGQLFTAESVDTLPCAHCGAPAVEIDKGTVHFEVAETGAKTSWDDCFIVVRGRRKLTRTVAELAR